MCFGPIKNFFYSIYQCALCQFCNPTVNFDWQIKLYNNALYLYLAPVNELNWHKNFSVCMCVCVGL